MNKHIMRPSAIFGRFHTVKLLLRVKYVNVKNTLPVTFNGHLCINVLIYICKDVSLCLCMCPFLTTCIDVS